MSARQPNACLLIVPTPLRMKVAQTVSHYQTPMMFDMDEELEDRCNICNNDHQLACDELYEILRISAS